MEDCTCSKEEFLRTFLDAPNGIPSHDTFNRVFSNIDSNQSETCFTVLYLYCLFDHKMNLARQLLLDTDKTIFEIALDCGYDYASHFTTAFKRKYGITPKQFKGVR